MFRRSTLPLSLTSVLAPVSPRDLRLDNCSGPVPSIESESDDDEIIPRKDWCSEPYLLSVVLFEGVSLCCVSALVETVSLARPLHCPAPPAALEPALLTLLSGRTWLLFNVRN